MPWIPRRFGLLLLVYLAAVGYALVAWLPTIVGGYRDLVEANPRLATAYLSLVLLGGGS